MASLWSAFARVRSAMRRTEAGTLPDGLLTTAGPLVATEGLGAVSLLSFRKEVLRAG